MQAQSLAKSIFGSGGGLLGGIGDWFSGMFRADGGPVAGGSSYIVGERGPELFTPGVSGNITPNGGTGGMTLVQNIHIDSRSDQASIAVAMRAASQQALNALNQSLQRGGSFARAVGTA
jgi:phage-related minor tail protein